MTFDSIRNLRYLEPARIQAAWFSFVAFAATLGFGVSQNLSKQVIAGIALLAVLLPLIQGERTRARVVPERVSNADVLEALYEEPPFGVEDSVLVQEPLTDSQLELLPEDPGSPNE